MAEADTCNTQATLRAENDEALDGNISLDLKNSESDLVEMLDALGYFRSAQCVWQPNLENLEIKSGESCSSTRRETQRKEAQNKMDSAIGNGPP